MAKGDTITLDQLKQRHAEDIKAVKAASQPISDTQETQTPSQSGGFRNFFGGFMSGVTSPGRTIQNMLPASISTIGGRESDKATRQGVAETLGASSDSRGFGAGEFVGEAATFISPGGATRGVANLGFQGARSFGMQSLNEGEVNRSSFAAGAADAFVPPVLNKGVEIGGTVLKGLASGLSGAGTDAVDMALQRPGATFRAIGNQADEGVKEVATKVREGVQNLYKSAGDEYASLLKEADITELPKKDILNKAKSLLQESDDAITFNNKGIQFVDSTLTDAEERQLTKLFNRVKKWSDFTPTGVNRLATTISRFRRGGADTDNFDRIVDGLRRGIREVAGDVAPTIRESNERFADKMDLLDEIENVLKTNSQLGTREGIRKTSEALSRLFNGNKELSREVVEDLEQALGIDILGSVAGQQLSEVAPRSTARIGGAVDSAIQAVGNPVVRNALPLIGVINQELVQRVTNVPGVPESARAALVQSIAELFEEIESASSSQQ